MVLRLEAVFVRRKILAEVFTPPITLQLVGIEIAVVLAEVARQECVVDRFQDDVEPLELVVDVEAARPVPRGGLAQSREHRHRQPLAQH